MGAWFVSAADKVWMDPTFAKVSSAALWSRALVPPTQPVTLSLLSATHPARTETFLWAYFKFLQWKCSLSFLSRSLPSPHFSPKFHPFLLFTSSEVWELRQMQLSYYVSLNEWCPQRNRTQERRRGGDYRGSELEKGRGEGCGKRGGEERKGARRRQERRWDGKTGVEEREKEN